MNTRCSMLVLAVSVMTLSHGAASAQTKGGLPELATDRPDFTESSEVVGRGIVQVEMGTTVEWNREPDHRDRAVTLPLALLRLGVSRRMELRVSGDGYVLNAMESMVGQSRSRGHADLEVGAKYLLREGGDDGFAFAVIPMASLPVGADGISSGAVDPTLKFTWATSLPRAFDISGNVNVSRLGDDLGRYIEHGLSVSIAHDLARGWGFYTEVFGFTPQGRPHSNAWTLDAGVSRLLGDNMQIDLEFGRGLTRAAPDWFVGAGVGIRTAALRRQ